MPGTYGIFLNEDFTKLEDDNYYLYLLLNMLQLCLVFLVSIVFFMIKL